MAVYSLQSLYEPTAETGATADTPPTVEEKTSDPVATTKTVTFPDFAKPTCFENVDDSSASGANEETNVERGRPRVRVAGRRTIQAKRPSWEGRVYAQIKPKTFRTPMEYPEPDCRFFHDRVPNLKKYKNNLKNPTMYYKNYDHKRQVYLDLYYGDHEEDYGCPTPRLGSRKRARGSIVPFVPKSEELIKHCEGIAQDDFLEATKDQVPKKEAPKPVDKPKLLPAFPKPSASNQIEDLVEDHDNDDIDFVDDYTDYYDGDTSNRAHQMAFALGDKDRFHILLYSKKFGELVKLYGTKTDNNSLMTFSWRTHVLWLAKTRTKPQLRKLLIKKHGMDPSKLVSYTKQDLICAVTEREGIHLFWMGDFRVCDRNWEVKKYKDYLKPWLKEPPPGLLGYYDPSFLKKYDFSTKGFKEFLVQ